MKPTFPRRVFVHELGAPAVARTVAAPVGCPGEVASTRTSQFPIPMGTASEVETEAPIPFKYVIAVSMLDHLNRFTGPEFSRLVRSAFRGALEIAASWHLNTIATPVLQGGWRLKAEDALHAMIDECASVEQLGTVDVWIPADKFESLAAFARGIGVDQIVRRR